ncbi:hypothetical protein F8388_010098 [Cannabis sativa]|uniref:Cytochrome P450 n=1 Tax=Cannabis sativa TaxID=3483 RepID=A0A7J6GRJ7_CANSA|nr:hypothetical protein F8388_010098 [Cannabis sativa]
MAFFIVVLSLIFVLCFCSALLRWNEVRYRKKGLPPGTMGWPVFGETTEFLKQGPNFMKNQRARGCKLLLFNGPLLLVRKGEEKGVVMIRGEGTVVFSNPTYLGGPTIVSMDPELNRYILMNEAKGLVPGYPQSMLDILGKCNIAAVHGSTHKYMRGALLALISPTMIRHQLLPKHRPFMRTHLTDWNDKVINIQEKTKEMALLSSLKQLAGIESGSMSQAFKPEFFKLVLGTLSLPIDLPGKEKYVSMLRQLIEERRTSQEVHQDMLAGLMRTEENRYKLSDDEIIDQIITIYILKEHLAIREKKKPEDPIDLNDLKVNEVILKPSRLATIVNGVLRKPTKDMELTGFLVPKGWRIYVYTRGSQLRPVFISRPFNFQSMEMARGQEMESQNYFFIFGGGTRQWEEVGGDKLMKCPRVRHPMGYTLESQST